MHLSQEKKHRLLRGFAASLACFLLAASAARAQQFPSFQQQYAGKIDPNSRFVALPTGLAKITALHFTLPKDTFTYNVAGMTVFPYYEASPELQSFLNSRVGAIPVTDLVTATASRPTIQLPQTDTIHINIPLSERRNALAPVATRMAWRGRGHDDVSWLVAHQSGQTYGVPGDSAAVVLAASGTMFNAAAPRTMALRCGTLWVLTASRPVAVLTRYGAVAVNPYSIAAVEQTWFNRVKTGVLSGKPLEFQVTYKGKSTKIEVEKGKELLVSESAVASSGTSDYVDQHRSGELIASRLPQTPVSLPELNINSRNIDADTSSFVSDLRTVNPVLTDLRMANAYKSMFEQYNITGSMRRDALRKQMLMKGIAENQPAAYKASLDARYFVPSYKPVNNSTPVIFPHVDEPIKSLWVKQGVVKYLESARIEVENGGRLDLNAGQAIFVATEPMTVRARDCFLEIRDGAIVQVISKRDAVIVRNLRELASDSVRLKVRSRSLKCAAGDEVIVAATMPTIYAQMKTDGVNRRNVHITEVSAGNVIINKSEIELTSLLQYDPSLRQICLSKDPYDQKVLAQIEKMDAVLTMVTRGHGSYQRMAGMPAVH